MNQETLIVNIKNLKSKNQSLDIITSAPRTKVSIEINGVDLGTITTNGFGVYNKPLDSRLNKKDKIELKATKKGYNPGSFSRTINR